jgi:hypothetical protein
MEKIENLIKLLPLGSVFILFCSSIRLVIYYKVFNISIVEYIGIHEFLTVFIDDLLLYFSIFGIGILLYLFDNIFNKSQDLVLKNTTPEKYKNERKVFLILLITTLSLIIILSNSTETKSKSIEIIGVGIFLMLSLLRVFLSSTKFTIPYPLLITAGIVIYTAMYAFSDAQKILEKKDRLNYTVVFKEKTYFTDKNLKYIGKTENYLFLYNLKSNRTTILKNDELIKINIK